MKERVYNVKKLDWRFPSCGEVVSTFSSVDYELANNKFMKLFDPDNCTPIETICDSKGRSYQFFWIGESRDFCVVLDYD